MLQCFHHYLFFKNCAACLSYLSICKVVYLFFIFSICFFKGISELISLQQFIYLQVFFRLCKQHTFFPFLQLMTVPTIHSLSNQCCYINDIRWELIDSCRKIHILSLGKRVWSYCLKIYIRYISASMLFIPCWFLGRGKCWSFLWEQKLLFKNNFSN